MRVRQVSLQPFTRKKKIISRRKKEIKRKEFYDSTVRTDDYMRKSGMNLVITLQILLKKALLKKELKIERDEVCVMMSVSENFPLREKDKNLSN